MLTIFNYLKKYKVTAIIALSLMLIELMVELFQPFIISKIIDDGIGQGNMDNVLLWGGVLLGMTVLAFAVGIISSFFASHVSQGFGYDLRESLFEKIQSFTFSIFNRFPESSLITRLTNDVLQLQNTVFMGLRVMMRAPLLVIGGTIMAFIIQPSLAIWLAMVVPFLALFLIWVMDKGQRLFRLVQQQLDHVNKIMQQNLVGMRIVRVFIRKDHEAERFSASSGQLMDRTMSALRLTEATMPIILFVMNLSVIAVLWFGRIQLDNSVATVGEIVAVLNYGARMTMALSILTWVIVNFSRARASAQRIEEVIEADIDIEVQDAAADGSDTRDRPFKGAISFEQVSFQYPDSELMTLKNITFDAKPGETIAIMGATGSGKSSLLQLIPRLYDAQRGLIRTDGMDYRLMNMEQLRNRIGYVPQEVMLFTGTIEDNIRFGKADASFEEIVEAAKIAQIHDTIMKLPQQYETIVGQKGVNLSGGQKQRLTIARAMVRKPVILFSMTVRAH